jgi:glycosyltransferase involved in cell wall biosynthesis
MTCNNSLRISLVTTCFNEAESVDDWIADVERQTRLPNEIVVVDAGSKDGTHERIRTWQPPMNVRIIQKTCTVAQGRNLAIRESDGEIIVSTDMGCRLDSNWVAALTAPFEEGHAPRRTDVVAGNYAVDFDTLPSFAAKADYFARNQYRTELVEGFLPSSRSIAYRREVWERLKGYPEDLSFAGDDTVFALQCYKEGCSITFAPTAIAYWRRPRTFRQLQKESYRYGRGNGEAALKTAWLKDADSPCGTAQALLKSVLMLARRSTLRNGMIALRKTGNPVYLPVVALYRALVSFANYQGFRDGFVHGKAHCESCRRRLEPTAP